MMLELNPFSGGLSTVCLLSIVYAMPTSYLSWRQWVTLCQDEDEYRRRWSDDYLSTAYNRMWQLHNYNTSNIPRLLDKIDNPKKQIDELKTLSQVEFKKALSQVEFKKTLSQVEFKSILLEHYNLHSNYTAQADELLHLQMRVMGLPSIADLLAIQRNIDHLILSSWLLAEDYMHVTHKEILDFFDMLQQWGDAVEIHVVAMLELNSFLNAFQRSPDGHI